MSVLARGDTSFLEDLKNTKELSAEELLELEDSLRNAELHLPAEISLEATPDIATSPEALPAAADTPTGLEGDFRTGLSKMSLPQKLKLALFGNGVCRALLINDPNRLVQRAVLKNPRIRITEIEEFSKNKNVSDSVLRIISDSNEWTRSYIVKLNLTVHPKSPPDLSMKWLRYLQISDVKKIARSKNVPQLVAITARKRLADEPKR